MVYRGFDLILRKDNTWVASTAHGLIKLGPCASEARIKRLVDIELDGDPR